MHRPLDFRSTKDRPAEPTGHEPTFESIQRRHEVSDLSAKSIVTFLAILAIGVVLVAVAVVGLFAYLEGREARMDQPPSPLALGRQVFPEPRLQPLPSLDLAAMREREAAVLSKYGWVSREAQIVHIPIEQAMQQVVERKLPIFPVVPMTPAAPTAQIGDSQGDVGQAVPQIQQPGAEPTPRQAPSQVGEAPTQQESAQGVQTPVAPGQVPATPSPAPPPPTAAPTEPQASRTVEPAQAQQAPAPLEAPRAAQTPATADAGQ